jgi:hypothetical protein
MELLYMGFEMPAVEESPAQPVVLSTMKYEHRRGFGSGRAPVIADSTNAFRGGLALLAAEDVDSMRPKEFEKRARELVTDNAAKRKSVADEQVALYQAYYERDQLDPDERIRNDSLKRLRAAEVRRKIVSAPPLAVLEATSALLTRPLIATIGKPNRGAAGVRAAPSHDQPDIRDPAGEIQAWRSKKEMVESSLQRPADDEGCGPAADESVCAYLDATFDASPPGGSVGGPPVKRLFEALQEESFRVLGQSTGQFRAGDVGTVLDEILESSGVTWASPETWACVWVICCATPPQERVAMRARLVSIGKAVASA